MGRSVNASMPASLKRAIQSWRCKLPLKWDREKREDSDFSTRNRTMKRSRFTESQIVAILKEADAGVKVTDVCRRHGISQPTYYSWKSRYGGLGVSELKRIKELEADHSKLKRMVADLAMESEQGGDRQPKGLPEGRRSRQNQALKELIEKKL